ncbi:hypothetical protein BJ508DRAFT_300982 [Ascobolus immersus RN42]|uniref:Uncharacterized protein n=1 Tax=Ascobolus immersus RN42 TaxID=1160509 RepID=A0A3N4INL3_ASCIM|nr:hypothetical protein BJ508DRAFT_300982 [Ascobolus immersus RN42]
MSKAPAAAKSAKRSNGPKSAADLQNSVSSRHNGIGSLSVIPATSQPERGRAVGLLDGIVSPKAGKEKPQKSNTRSERETLPAVVTSFTQQYQIEPEPHSLAFDRSRKGYYRYSTTPEYTPVQSQEPAHQDKTNSESLKTKSGNMSKDSKKQNTSNRNNMERSQAPQPSSIAPILRKSYSKRQASEELYHRDDVVENRERDKKKQRKEREHSMDTSSDAEEINRREGTDDFENPHFTPEEDKHPDDFKDEDACDPDFEPLESPSEYDEDEFVEKSQDSKHSTDHDADGEEDDGEDTKGSGEQKNMDDNGIESNHSSIRTSTESDRPEFHQETISVIKNACYYLHEDHEGTCKITCTNFDWTIKQDHLPGRLPRNIVYELDIRMTPQGVPMIAVVYHDGGNGDGDICGWVPYSSTAHPLLERFILAFHKIRARISWQASVSTGKSKTDLIYHGTCVWEAACDDGDGLDLGDDSDGEEDFTTGSPADMREGQMNSSGYREGTSPVSHMLRQEEEEAERRKKEAEEGEE